MFTTKFPTGGKIYPLASPRDGENKKDITLLDFVTTDEYISSLKLESQRVDSLREICTFLANQVKGSRLLLSLTTNYSSKNIENDVAEKILASADLLFNVQSLHVLKHNLDSSTFTVVWSNDKNVVGRQMNVEASFAGNVMKENAIVKSNEGHISSFDASIGGYTRQIISAPIIVNGAIWGVVEACNNKDSTGFSNHDEIIMGYLSSNFSLLVSQLSLSTTIESSNIQQVRLSDKMEEVAKFLYNASIQKLDADRISLFIYNVGSRQLECEISQDIKGYVLSPDVGIAGAVFKSKQLLNVHEVKADVRHYREVDLEVGYETKTVLCAPILDDVGNIFGIIQAVNKKNGHQFTPSDEANMIELCKETLLLLKVDKKEPFVSDQLSESTEDLVSSVCSMMMSATFKDISIDTERLAKALSSCDDVGIYSLSNERGSTTQQMKALHSSESGSFFSIPVDQVDSYIVEVFRYGTRIDRTFTTTSGQPGEVIPGVTAHNALILPVRSQVQGGSYMALVATRNSTQAPFSAGAKQNLQLLSNILGNVLNAHQMREKQEDVSNMLASNFHFVNSTLAVISEYAILLNPSGIFIASNKPLTNFLGEDTVEGHYSGWLTDSNSHVLCTDIADALSSNRPIHQTNVEFTSPAFTSDARIDYKIVAIDIEGIVTADFESRNVQAFIIIFSVKGSDTSTPTITASPSSSGGYVLSMKGSTEELTPQSLGTIAAKDVLEVAKNLIQTADRTNAVMEPEMKQNLKGVTAMLVDAASRLVKVNPVQELDTYSSAQKEMALQTTVSAVGMDPSQFAIVTDVLSKFQPLTLEIAQIGEPAGIFEWEFSALEHPDTMSLFNILGRIFKHMFDLKELEVEEECLASYMYDVSQTYHDNPFHNLMHATTVTHFCHKLIYATNAAEHLTQRQLFAIMISAVVHDVDHPGNTNVFEINSQSNLALLYNDQSVLEHHHCSTAFRLMRKPTSNILGKMQKANANQVRQSIVSCVLATDMSVHFQLVDETKKRTSEGWKFAEIPDQVFFCKILLHAADLSNPTRPFSITKSWAERISEEFNRQVKKEQELGLPVLGFMMTPDEKALCKNETGFASFVVAPMWRSLAILFPSLNHLVDQLDQNLNSWKALLQEILDKEEDSEEEED